MPYRPVDVLPTKDDGSNGLLLFCATGLVVILVLDVLHQARVVGFVPPELTLSLQGRAYSHHNIG